MTDVLITHRIPGAKAGDVLPLDDRLQRHVDAGNAEILPNKHEAWRGEEVFSEPARVHDSFGTGNLEDLTIAELDAATTPDDEDTEDGD